MVDIIIYGIEGLVLLLWLGSIYHWYKNGMPIPRWVHILAVVLFLSGLASLITINMIGAINTKLVLALLILPPAASYFGWLWMKDPAFDEV